MQGFLRTCALVGGVLLGGGYLAAAPQQAAAPVADENQAFIAKYCISCHSERAKTGGLSLERIDVKTPEARTDVWEKVVRKLRAGAMPPQGMPQPTRAASDHVAEYLEGQLDKYAAANPNPGRTLIHRLNRTEYAKAVQDILGVEIDVESMLPADSSSYGFDNNADTLTVSPALLEKYLAAADKIGVLALGDPKARTEAVKIPIKFDLSQNQRMAGMPLGTSGGAAVKYNFPADGMYTLGGKLYSAHNSSDRGQVGEDVATDFEIAIDGKRVYVTYFGGKEEEWDSYRAYMGMHQEIMKRMTVTVPVKAGVHTVTFGFIGRKLRESGSQRLYRPAQRTEVEGSEAGGPAQLESVSIKGPMNPTGVSDNETRRKILTCKVAPNTDELPCARKILGKIAEQAYRRPVEASEMEKLLTYFQRGRNKGSFEDGLKLSMSRILTSTNFLFRAELDPAGLTSNKPYPVSDIELASRLSFFLWSSVPDEELLGIAKKGTLREPAVLRAQVKRMLADARAKRLVENFTGQWLGLRGVPALTPDPQVYHDFDDQVRQAMRTETEMLFESVLRDDRSVFEILNADYTFVNERLAKHYGIPGIAGDEFRRVKVTDPNRVGILGHASILTLSSNPTRTSPVKRGKWILTTLLSTPPPPPPPNVPPLAENAAGEAPKSVRERLEKHRAPGACSACHRTIDPPGFALENFNPIGQWRDKTEDGKPVDTSGVLWDGSKVSGPADLRKAIMARSDLFISTVTERMLTYALGRGVEFGDMPLVRTIDREAAKDDNRLTAIILGVVKSAPFQMRSGPAADTQSAAVLPNQ